MHLDRSPNELSYFKMNCCSVIMSLLFVFFKARIFAKLLLVKSITSGLLKAVALSLALPLN